MNINEAFFNNILPEGWEVDSDEEGGQPNGNGTIEPSDYREWFSDMRESHHRQRITLYGSWEEGPRDYILKRQEARRWDLRREAQEREERTLHEAKEILARRADDPAKEANS